MIYNMSRIKFENARDIWVKEEYMNDLRLQSMRTIMRIKLLKKRMEKLRPRLVFPS